MSKPKLIAFSDNKGNVLNLNSKMTLEELMKIGVIKIEVVEKGIPLADNWYRDAGDVPKE